MNSEKQQFKYLFDDYSTFFYFVLQIPCELSWFTCLLNQELGKMKVTIPIEESVGICHMEKTMKNSVILSARNIFFLRI